MEYNGEQRRMQQAVGGKEASKLCWKGLWERKAVGRHVKRGITEQWRA